MTINFEFINFFSLAFIINLISSLLGIASNIFLIKSGKNQLETIKFSKNLIFAGIINIIFILLLYFIPNIIYTGSIFNPNIQIYIAYKIFQGLFFSIPPLFTFGFTFFVFGRTYLTSFGTHLRNAGFFWIIANIVNVIYLNGHLSEILYRIIGINVFSITTINIIFYTNNGLLNLFANIFLIIHGYRNNDKHLMTAAIIYFLGWIISTFLLLLINTVSIPYF